MFSLSDSAQVHRWATHLHRLQRNPWIVYGAALPAAAGGSTGKSGSIASTPIGPACRVCERVGCLARAEPPVTRPLGLDEMATGLSAFDFQ